jgi:DNA-binding MarR family transcriptional regulator
MLIRILVNAYRFNLLIWTRSKRTQEKATEMKPNTTTCDCETDAPLVHALFTIHHLMMRVGDRLTAPHGLTASRWMLLCALDRRGDSATVSDLAEEQMMSVQAISRMLVTMVDEGLVVKQNRTGFGRTAFVSLTPRGRESVSVLRRLGEGFTERFLEGFTEPGITRMQADLGRLIDNLQRFENDLTTSRESEAIAREEECA